MRFKRSATIVGTALFIGGFAAGASAAPPTLTPSTADAGAATSVINVQATGLSSTFGSNVVIQQCKRNGNDPAVTDFDEQLDCSQFTTFNTTAVGGAINFNFEVFNGTEPNLGEWGCGPLAPVGQQTPTCFIRVTPGTANNTGVDEFAAFTYEATQVTTTTTEPVVTTTTVVPGAEIPEVPLNFLLPASAAVVIAGAVVLARRRAA